MKNRNLILKIYKNDWFVTISLDISFFIVLFMLASCYLINFQDNQIDFILIFSVAAVISLAFSVSRLIVILKCLNYGATTKGRIESAITYKNFGEIYYVFSINNIHIKKRLLVNKYRPIMGLKKDDEVVIKYFTNGKFGIIDEYWD